MRRLLTLLLASVVALLLVAGTACGGDDDDSAGEEGEATATVDSGDEPSDTDDSGAEPTETGDSGGEPDADAVAYFEAVDEIASPMYEDLADIANGIDSATFDSDEEEIQANRDALQSFGETLEVAFTSLADLTPPDNAQDEHDNFIEALMNYAALTSTVLAQLEGVETVEGLDAVMTDSQTDTTGAFTDYDATCRNLEDQGEEVIDGYDIYCPVDDQ